MQIGTLSLDYEFSGVAGEAQRAGATATLVRELGDSYGSYHQELVDALARLGGRPDPQRVPDPGRYFRAWSRVEAIVGAEAVLRICRAYRQDGRPLGTALSVAVPLIDGKDRLVDVTEPLQAAPIAAAAPSAPRAIP